MGILTTVQSIEATLDKLEAASIIHSENTATIAGRSEPQNSVPKGIEIDVASRIFNIAMRLQATMHAIDKNVETITESINGRPEPRERKSLEDLPVTRRPGPSLEEEANQALDNLEDPDFAEVENFLQREFPGTHPQA